MSPSGVARPTGDVHVADRLATIVAERESQLVLGLDPDPARLWPDATRATGAATPAARAAAAVLAHCQAVIDAVGDAIGRASCRERVCNDV